MKKRSERGDAAFIELRLVSSREGDDRVDVIINGRDLIDSVRQVELSLAADDRQREMAGAYAGLYAWQGESLSIIAGDRVAVLGCECGEAECWPLQVRITRRESTVTWSDFLGPAGEGYEALGRFIFRREQYEAAVAAILFRGG